AGSGYRFRVRRSRSGTEVSREIFGGQQKREGKRTTAVVKKTGRGHIRLPDVCKIQFSQPTTVVSVTQCGHQLSLAQRRLAGADNSDILAAVGMGQKRTFGRYVLAKQSR